MLNITVRAGYLLPIISGYTLVASEEISKTIYSTAIWISNKLADVYSFSMWTTMHAQYATRPALY